MENVKPLEKKEIQKVSESLARAFEEDPLFLYCLDGMENKHEKRVQIFKVLLKYGLRYGNAVNTQNLEGSMAWFSQIEKYEEISTWRLLRSGGLTLVLKLGIKCLKRLDVASEIIVKLRAKYTKKESHWYLAIIGVDPNYQGKGFASILLKYLISTSDSYPIYLETFVEKNVPIYEHFNFKVVEIATVPDANIPIWAMLRK